MSVYQISPYALEREFRDFFESFGAHMDALTQILVGMELNLAAVPKRIGPHVAPYAFAGKVLLLLDYARSDQNLSREFIESAIDEYALLLTGSMSKSSDTIDWDAQASSLIARIFLAALCRLKCTEHRRVNEREITALTGFTPERLKAKGIEFEEENGERTYSPNDVQRLVNLVKEVSLD